MLEVILEESSDPMKFLVSISEDGAFTHFRVTMSLATYNNTFNTSVSPEKCIEAAFLFLLDREPKEAILTEFDITVIPGYFPEFNREILGYLERVKT